MPDYFSMTVVLAVFYTVFVGQIYILSIYIPNKICDRVEHVLRHFPPQDYPKLYPVNRDGLLKRQGRAIRVFRVVNYLIAAVGFLILSVMYASDYTPHEKGGDETFVMLYFLFQVGPFFYISIKEYKQFKLMREAYTSNTRTAELQPRRLFDFISPIWVVLAAILYICWLVFYLNGANVEGPLSWENYVTIAGITGMNIAYIILISANLLGKKVDPYKAYKDHLKQIESMVKSLVFSSVMISIFLIATQAADQYALEVFDPPLTSFYMQLCIIFGAGLTLRLQRVETTNFEVYKRGPRA
ncbi:MAG: hypothetical protein JKY57_05110 [Kordiimonadaceae bacterium]|nr:hypothetical protein [Kordiimonadaceae bacterium]